MGKVVLGVWVVVLLFAGFWFGYYQEGANQDITLEYKLEGVSPQGGDFSLSGPIYMTGDKAAVVFKGRVQGKDLSGKVIMDMSAKKMTALLDVDGKKIYMTEDIKLVGKDKCKPASSSLFGGSDEIKRLPESKTIEGLRCHGFGSKAKDEKGRFYFTYELPLGRDHIAFVNKFLRIDSSGNGGGFNIDIPGAADVEESDGKHRQFSSLDYFPLPLYADDGTAHPRTVYEVTKISRDKIDSKVFEVPKGYQKVEPFVFVMAVVSMFGGPGGMH